ncbi:MAG: efflux RND transporter periplasmic adaptor subunit [Ignavibacteria bacterium]|nr:efflux RND transporter periplasmic adaptor subunit [Ignavibacteria bacterium]
MKSAIIIVVLAVLVGLTACRSEKTVPPTVETEHHGEHENENTAILTDEQMKSVHVQLGSIEKKQLTASLRANGILEVPNQNKASATASMGGVIKSIQVQTGSNVRKGQVIATITNSSFITLQEDYLSVSSKSELAELEYARQKELQQGNATALKNLQSADAELKTLKAKRASLRKQLELIGISAGALTTENIQSTVSIRSPISGVIRDVKVNIGSYVDANSPIAEIVDNSQLHLDLFVYEKDLPKMRVGQTIHFTLTNNPGQEYDADIYAISNTFDPTSKAVAVHAIVKGNKQGLIDKMSITALVSLENATVDAVPTDAIVNHEGQDYIFIVTDAHAEEEHHSESETTEHKHDEQGHGHGEKEEPKHQARDESKHKEKGTTFERIPIRKGTTDVGYSEITLLKEIPANSRVAVKGAFFILAKMNNKGEGHAH